MIDIEHYKEMIIRAGWFPSTVLIGGWIYIPVLLFVFVYNLFLKIIKSSNHEKRL